MAAISTPATPAPSDRDAVLEVVRVPLSTRLGKPVALEVRHLRAEDGWAFLRAEMRERSGKPLSYAGTPYAEDAAHGVKSRDYVALLRRGPTGRWRLVEQAIGPTDVIWVDWADKHRVPAAIFPS